MKESLEKETTVETWYYMRTLASVEILSQTALNQDLMLKVVVTSFERKPSRVCFGCIASIRARGVMGHCLSLAWQIQLFTDEWNEVCPMCTVDWASNFLAASTGNAGN